MQLYLVRHGETEWNILGKYQGWIDIPLNEVGKHQASCLKKPFYDKQIDAIYVSDSSRAIATAEPIREVTQAPLTIDPRLREIDVGAWEGLTYDEIQKKYPNHPANRLRSARMPEGESFNDVHERTASFLDDLWKSNPSNSTIVIVTHGGVIREWFQGWLGNSSDERVFYPVFNTSVTLVESTDGFQSVRIIYTNNTTHLEENN